MNKFIPKNPYIEEGYYSINELLEIIRNKYSDKELVFFILDMIEE
jgi:hypothetical protein